MAWTPAFPKFGGMLPVMEAAKAIIERDISEALAWRSSLDGSTAGDPYARIQFTQRHSQSFPLLIIQPATDTPATLGSGGMVQSMVFDCEIFITASIVPGDQGQGIDDLARSLQRYYDATRMAFLSAADADWFASFPVNDRAGKIDPWCSNAVFGQLQQSREVNSEYLHSVGFELQLRFIEAQ